MEYKLNDKTKKFINNTIQKELGISYDEFAVLDAEEQNKLMAENRKHKPKTDTVLEMIGSGEHAIFTEVKRGERIMLEDGTIVIAGLSPEEESEQIDKELNEIIGPKKLIKRIFK